MTGVAGLPATMRAVRLLKWGAAPELVKIPVPRPTGAEVLLRVTATGLCQSDLHVMDAAPGDLPYELPFTLGHEIAGVVVATGDDVDPSWLDADVAVHGVWSCGRCRSCVRGRENYCLTLAGGPVGGGLGRDGGLADYVLVPGVHHLVRHGGIPPTSAAPLTDAGLTAQHAVSLHAAVAEGGTALLVGVGGLGHLALQLLRAAIDVRVVAVDSRAEARALALRLGADLVTADTAGLGELLEQLGRGPGADLVLDFVGSPETMAAAGAVLAPGGRLVVVGSAGGSLDASKGPGLPAGWTLTAPFWGSAADLGDVVVSARAGSIAPTVEVRDLDDVLAAYDDLRAGRVDGRLVVVP